jgi:hypothetical protein
MNLFMFFLLLTDVRQRVSIKPTIPGTQNPVVVPPNIGTLETNNPQTPIRTDLARPASM